ncbi:MAG: hypothetical protein NZO58_04605, partial [Gemmataceae bacterium]|nr:hypothetical protein [Gemmataceae bacterium]
ISPGSGLLLDIGSTTTDIVPLWNGRPAAQGLTDPERLAADELVYTGARRTPVCAVIGPDDHCAAEWFATMLDVYLVLGDLAEEPGNCDTADGRPATRAAARARLARMWCSDVERFSWRDARGLARRAAQRQLETIRRAVDRVARRLPAPPQHVVIAGSGDFLARRAVSVLGKVAIVSLRRKFSPAVANAACAYALACLGDEFAAETRTSPSPS